MHETDLREWLRRNLKVEVRVDSSGGCPEENMPPDRSIRVALILCGEEIDSDTFRLDD